MKLRYHLIWIASIFILAIVPLFYILYAWGYLPNKEWNANANSTECLVVDANIVNAVCHYGTGSWQGQPLCYSGRIGVQLAIVKMFDVAYGSYSVVNETLSEKYRVGTYIECVSQSNNMSDFELHLKPTAGPLAITISIPVGLTIILILWTIGAFCSRKKVVYELI